MTNIDSLIKKEIGFIKSFVNCKLHLIKIFDSIEKIKSKTNSKFSFSKLFNRKKRQMNVFLIADTYDSCSLDSLEKAIHDLIDEVNSLPISEKKKAYYIKECDFCLEKILNDIANGDMENASEKLQAFEMVFGDFDGFIQETVGCMEDVQLEIDEIEQAQDREQENIVTYRSPIPKSSQKPVKKKSSKKK